MIFLFSACTDETEEVSTLIEGKFVSISNANVCSWDLNWTNRRQLTSDDSSSGSFETYYENPLWSSDGSQIICTKLFGSRSSSVIRMDSNGDNPEQIFQINERILTMDWSNDDEWIAYSTKSGNGIHIVSMDGQEFKILLEDSEQVQFISWSEDSRKIAACNSSNDLFIVDVDTKELNSIHNCSGINSKPYWTPDGEFIAYSRITGSFQGQIVTINVNNNLEETIKETNGSMLDYFVVFRWTPDGKYITYLARLNLSGTLEAMQVSTGLVVDLNYTQEDFFDELPNGDLFIFP